MKKHFRLWGTAALLTVLSLLSIAGAANVKQPIDPELQRHFGRYGIRRMRAGYPKAGNSAHGVLISRIPRPSMLGNLRTNTQKNGQLTINVGGCL